MFFLSSAQSRFELHPDVWRETQSVSVRGRLLSKLAIVGTGQLLAFALVLSGCASRPLVTVPWELSESRTDQSATPYIRALAAAGDLVRQYRERVNATSTYMLLNHLLEAAVGGSAATALLGGPDDSSDSSWGTRETAAAFALVGLIAKVVSDEGDLGRQKEGYARGISVIECAVAATKQTNPAQSGLAVTETLDAAEERVRADILLGALRAVHSSVAASVTNANLGDTRNASIASNGVTPPTTSGAESRDNKPDNWQRLKFWTDATNRCLSRLAPDIRPFEVG